MSTIQFKRGTPERWKEINPILESGEPGFEYTTNKLKIGDGMTPWNELPYLCEDNVFNAQTHYDFPSIGKENVIYKAEDEKLILNKGAGVKTIFYKIEINEKEKIGTIEKI